MKKTIIALVVVSIAVMSGCKALDKAKKYATVDNLKRVNDLMSIDFGKGPDGPFKVSPAGTKDAELVIQNNTDRTITVDARGPVAKKFVIKAGKNGSAVVTPGNYHFRATAEKVNPCEGDVALKGFNRYTWAFIISQR